MQRTSSSEEEEKEENWKINSIIKAYYIKAYYKATAIKKVWCWCKDEMRLLQYCRVQKQTHAFMET